MKFIWYLTLTITIVTQVVLYPFGSQFTAANAVLQLNDNRIDYAMGSNTGTALDMISIILLIVSLFSVYKILIITLKGKLDDTK